MGLDVVHSDLEFGFASFLPEVDLHLCCDITWYE